MCEEVESARDRLPLAETYAGPQHDWWAHVPWVLRDPVHWVREDYSGPAWSSVDAVVRILSTETFLESLVRVSGLAALL